MFLRYLVKHSIRVLQENGNEMSSAHYFKFEVLYAQAIQWHYSGELENMYTILWQILPHNISETPEAGVLTFAGRIGK